MIFKQQGSSSQEGQSCYLTAALSTTIPSSLLPLPFSLSPPPPSSFLGLKALVVRAWQGQDRISPVLLQLMF